MREKQLRHAFREAGVRPRALAAGGGLAVAATLVSGSSAQAVSAVFQVDKLADTSGGSCTAMPDDCSLRDAITQSNLGAGDTITFASGVTGTIQLGSYLPTITARQTIEGPGPGALTIAAGSPSDNTLYTNTTGGAVSISGLTITGGYAGIYSHGSQALSVSNVALSASSYGVRTYSPTVLDQSTVSGNLVGIWGGDVTVKNSTVANNNAYGVYARNGQATLMNSTVSGNGTGIQAKSAAVTLESSIVAGNRSEDVYIYSNSTLAENFSLVQYTGRGLPALQSGSGNNLNGQDPQLGPLADNGGATTTMKPADASPVVDKGKDYVGTGKDQRGESIFDRTSIANADDGRDMGAVEVQAVAPAVSSVSPGRGDAGDTVTINGTDFTGASGVKFGSTDATGFTRRQRHADHRDRPGGERRRRRDGHERDRHEHDLRSDKFHYIAPPAVSSLSPSHGNPGRTVDIDGTDFTGATAVKFGTTDATASASSTTRRSRPPSRRGAAPSDVRVTTPKGTSATGSGDEFTYSTPIEVDTLTDDAALDDCTDADDDCSLRGAIANANAEPLSTITFASDVTGTIQLGSDLPHITAGETIDGPGPKVLTIKPASPNDGALYADTNGGAVSIRGLTVTDGYNGIVAVSSQALSVSNVALSDNRFGVSASSPTVVEDSTISGNYYGVSGSDLTLKNSTIADNTSYGVFANSGQATLKNSTVSGNARESARTSSPVTLESSVVAGSQNGDVTQQWRRFDAHRELQPDPEHDRAAQPRGRQRRQPERPGPAARAACRQRRRRRRR